MKKIMFYIDSLRRGGAQRVMANLADYFATAGYDVVLVNDFVQKGTDHYNVSDNVERIYLRDDNSGNVIIKNISRVLRLRRIIKDKKPDLILSFLGRPNKRMLIASLGIKVKKVVSVRNDPNREYGFGGLKKAYAKQLFKLADGCVFQTDEAAGYFPLKVQKRSIVIFNPVGQKIYASDRSLATQNIVTVGRMEKQKNHRMLIEAFSMISDAYPEENLIIYGDGPLRNDLISYIDELGLSDRIKLPGNISDVDTALSKAKVFVLSSDYEGMPNALMEAMAMGVPCISTDCPCGGPKMLIESEQQGILTPCKDATALSDKLRYILDNEQLRQVMSAAAKKRAEQFRPEVIYQQWENYLNTVAEK